MSMDKVVICVGGIAIVMLLVLLAAFHTWRVKRQQKIYSRQWMNGRRYRA